MNITSEELLSALLTYFHLEEDQDNTYIFKRASTVDRGQKFQVLIGERVRLIEKFAKFHYTDCSDFGTSITLLSSGWTNKFIIKLDEYNKIVSESSISFYMDVEIRSKVLVQIYRVLKSLDPENVTDLPSNGILFSYDESTDYDSAF